MSDLVSAIEWASESQKLFFERGPAPTLASGGFGSSKTFGAILKLLYLADIFPGYRAVIIRRRYNELWKTTLPTLFKLVTPDMYSQGRRNDQLGELVLNNGSRFDFIHLERADISSVLMGLEINAALFDQAEEMLEDTYDILTARLGRWDKAFVPPQLIEDHEKATGQDWPYVNAVGARMAPSYMLLTCNPDIEIHWLWRRFHPDSKEWQEKWRHLGYQMINFDSRDNKFLGQQNLTEMLSKEETWQKRYVRGEWGRPEGVLFDVSPLSILDPTPELLDYITNHCTLHRVMDHGFSAPTCCLWCGVDKEDNTFIYREYYLASDQIREHRANITAMSMGEKYASNLADPAIHAQMPGKQGGRWSVADEFVDCRIYPASTRIWWNKADNNEMASRARLKEYLRVDPDRIHPITREKGAPRLFFLQRTDTYPNGCQFAINETKAARLHKVGTINGKPIFSDERDGKVPDHALDPIRYFLLSRPGKAQPTIPSVSSNTFAGYEKLAKDTKKYRMQIEALYK